MGKVLRADCSAADAYAQADQLASVPTSTLWYVTFKVAIPSSTFAALAAASKNFSADFFEFSDGIYLVPDNPATWALKEFQTDYNPGAAAGSFTPDTWHTITMARSGVHPLEHNQWAVDGGATLFDYPESAYGSAQFGGIFADHLAGEVYYIDDVKIGTTPGGSDIFADDFESGDLSAWSSTSGAVTVVDDPFGLPTELPVADIIRDGIAPPSQTASDHSNGMFFSGNDERIVVEIASTDAGPQSVGFVIAEEIDGEPANDKTVPVPAGATRYAGPFPETFYNQVDGSVKVRPSVDTTLKLRAYRLPEDVVILDGE